MDVPMFHCKACDKMLREDEINRVTLHTQEHVNLCDNCFEDIATDVPLSSGDVSLDEVLIEEDDVGEGLVD